MAVGETDFRPSDESHALDGPVDRERLGMGPAMIAQHHEADACFLRGARDLRKRSEPVREGRVHVERSEDVRVRNLGRVAKDVQTARSEYGEAETESGG